MSEETPEVATPEIKETVVEAPPINVENIPNYLWQSIVVTILCCWPLGIPAIIFSAKVNGFVLKGDVTAAREASSKAKMWCWISFGLGIVAGIIGIIFQLLFLAGAVASSGY